jgi:hypothetical protein
MLSRRTSALAAGLVVLAVCASLRAGTDPWGSLTDDSWIAFDPGNPPMTLTPVNAGLSYALGFDQAAAGDKARGMNALVFSWGGSQTGHLASPDLAGSFAISNTGDSRTFADLVLVVAIDAPTLPFGFSLSLGETGKTAYAFDPPHDFTFYDHPGYDTDRPSGYYSITSPTGEPIAYDFSSGMVTAWAAEGVNLGPGGTASFDYAFANLPGRAVFSVYGHDAEVGWIYHTNRAVLDDKNSGKPVSTFEVLPEPGTLALVALGAAVLAERRRRWQGARRG